MADDRAFLLGPLTTTWTQPSSCSTNVHPYTSETAFREVTIPIVTMGLTCKDTSGVTTSDYTGSVVADVYAPAADPSCFPPAIGSRDVSGFFSPGLVCPQSYTTACHTTGGGGGNFEFLFSVLANETAIGCCPSKYDCYNDLTTRKCTYTATSTTFIQQDCYSLTRSSFTMVVPTGEQGEAYSYTSAVVMVAPMFQLNWQSSDLPVTTNSATIITTKTVSVMNTGLISPTAIPIELSTGAKAGIGVGAAIGALTIIGILAWFILRHRRTKLPAYQDSSNRASELQGQQRHEVSGENIEKLKAGPQPHLPELYQDSGVDQRQHHEMGVD